ncbi:MAG: aldo/keto reductase [bacterium]|nr:aldo/keto reductase [bacterium]
MDVGLKTAGGEAVRPLGLAGNPDTESRFVQTAYDAGVNVFFFYNMSFKGLTAGLGRLLKQERDRVFVATGTESRDPKEMNAYFERVRRVLGVDAVDVFFAEYVSPGDDVDEMVKAGGAIHQIREWKKEGKVRYVGATSHNRPLSLDLIRSGQIEVLMHRYNMAHRGAEAEVLPAAMEAGVPVVAFTSTRWGSLLKGHAGWKRSVPSAADCYRYVLRHPGVRLALTAPGTEIQLRENLAVLQDEGEPDADVVAEWEAYGKLVYGDGTDAFEARWP